MDTQNSDPQDQSPKGTQQPVSSQLNQGNGQNPPSQYVSGGNKESAPISQPRETVQVQHPDQAPDIADEVREAGVEATQPSEIVKLPEEVKQIGVQPAKESVPVSTEPSGAISFPTPVPPAQAQQEAKGETDKAETWRANIILRVLKKLGIKDAA